MNRPTQLKAQTRYEFTLEDHGDLCITQECVRAEIGTYRNNLCITLYRQSDNEPIGEVYLELYSCELAVNVCDQEHYGGDGERFILSEFEPSDATPEEIEENGERSYY